MQEVYCQNLVEILQSFRQEETPLEREVINVKTQEQLLMRVNVYAREDGTHDGMVVTFININDLKQIQKQLERTNLLLESIYANSPVGLCVLNDQLEFIKVNQTLAEMNGISIEDHLGKNIEEILPNLNQNIRDIFERVMNGEIIRNIEITGKTPAFPDKERYWISSYYPVNLLDGNRGMGSVVTEITRRKAMQKALKNSQMLLEEAQKIAHLGSWELCLETQEMNWSTEVYNILGIDNREIPNLDRLINLIIPEEQNYLMTHLDALKNEGFPFDLDFKLLRYRDGVIRYINIIGKATINEEKEITQIYGTILDISDRKQAELDLHERAFYDTITGLPNRNLFLDRLEYTLNRAIDYQENAAQRSSSSNANHFALLYLDLDQFKEVNDTQGHLVGDQLLSEVAKRLTQSLRSGDTICRLGGDEFAVILENISDEALAIATAQKIHDSLSLPFNLNNTQLTIQTSIGIALYKAELYQNQPLTLLLDNADIAMYQAKRSGPGQTVVFTPEMRAETEDKVNLKYELQRAIEEEEFVLYYQPIIELKSNELKGFEILVRWNHPQRGIISPGEFLPLLQYSYMLPSLEKWIIAEACRQCQQWIERFERAKNLIFSVNVSAQLLEEDNFVSWLQSLLQQVSLSPQQLMLEITETALIENSFLTQNRLIQLKTIGLRIALDDFGTGFSSLSHLHRFPLDIIKIDRSFVNEVSNNTTSANIVEGILYLSQKLNLTTTAEGIETPEQKEFLQDNGCKYAQGYLFSRPLSSDDIISWLSV